jgi:hypothetical protein
MKKIIITFSAVVLMFSSCKKCYECTCVDTTTLLGCTVEGSKIEMCETGLIGKTVLNARVLEKETEGYVCSVK